MTYQEEENQLIVLAGLIKEDGFSFGQDGKNMSAMARILYSRAADAELERDEAIIYMAARFRVFAAEFAWPVDTNDVKMFKAFSQLVFDWPQLLD